MLDIDTLEAVYGRQLDQLSLEEQQALARHTFHDNPFVLAAVARRGVRAPLWRPRLLRELARRDGGDMSAIDLLLLRGLRAMGPVRNAALARAVGMRSLIAYGHLYRLRRRGLVMITPDGYDVTEAGRSVVDLSWKAERRHQQPALFEV